MIRRITRSLSARLLAIFLITSMVYAFASRFAIELVLDRDYLREMIGAHISLHTDYFISDLGMPPDIERAKAIVATNPLDIRIKGPGLDWASAPGFPPEGAVSYQTGDPWGQAIEAEVSRRLGTVKKFGFAQYEDHSYIAVNVSDYEITVASPKIASSRPPNLTWPIIGLVSILVLAGCYFAVSWLIRPISMIKEGADRIGGGDLDYRIPTASKDDLGDLTLDINRMADDVQGMLEAKQQMLLAISHELRSPLTRTKVALEFMDDDQTRQSILEDVEEMERLIDDLLESERLNTRHSKLQRTSVNLAELIDKLLRTDFADRRERISYAPTASVGPDAIDATRIRLLVKNLVENALCYSSDDVRPVEVTISQTSDEQVLRVKDHGAGMSAEQVNNATEPFYRADSSRCRDTGGFGLGLYLCRRIAEAHGGSLKIDSEPGRGTEVTVRLPRASVAELAELGADVETAAV